MYESHSHLQAGPQLALRLARQLSAARLEAGLQQQAVQEGRVLLAVQPHPQLVWQALQEIAALQGVERVTARWGGNRGRVGNDERSANTVCPRGVLMASTCAPL